MEYVIHKTESYPVYTFDELREPGMDKVLDEWDDKDPSNPIIIYSFVTNMFKYAGHDMSILEIIETCKRNTEWFDDYEWTKQQHDIFVADAVEVLQNINIPVIPEDKERYVHMFLLEYGFRIKNESK